jgi:hypothetical protein
VTIANIAKIAKIANIANIRIETGGLWPPHVLISAILGILAILAMESLRAQRGDRVDRCGAPGREPGRQTGGRRQHRQDEALGDQLPDQSSASRADRRADCELHVPGRAAREQEAGDVDARDDQNQPDRQRQRVERRGQRRASRRPRSFPSRRIDLRPVRPTAGGSAPMILAPVRTGWPDLTTAASHRVPTARAPCRWPGSRFSRGRRQ